MPQCRQDQTIFGLFLLALVIVETLLIFAIMTWEHKSAERLAEEKRQQQRWKREQALRNNFYKSGNTLSYGEAHNRDPGEDRDRPDLVQKGKFWQETNDMYLFQKLKERRAPEKFEGGHDYGYVEAFDKMIDSHHVKLMPDQEFIPNRYANIGFQNEDDMVGDGVVKNQSHDKKKPVASVILDVLSNHINNDGLLKSKKFRQNRVDI